MENYSKISLGSAQFGLDYGIANNKGIVNPGEVHEILRLAKSLGINSIDTASNYGSSEKVIGDFLQANTGYNWSIATKISDNQVPVRKQFQISKRTLNATPTLVLFHSVDNFLDDYFRNEVCALKEDNRVSKIGVSIYNEKDLDKVLSLLVPDVIQLPLNILDTRLFLSGHLKKLKDLGVEIHARSVFLQGLFYLDHKSLEPRFDDCLEALEFLHLLSKENSITLSELSLLWVYNLKQVDKIILGVNLRKHLEEHRETLKKKIKSSIFDTALSLKYNNDKILNPLNWLY